MRFKTKSTQAICAIVSRNHLAQARHMIASYKKFHKNASTYVLVYDAKQAELSELKESFEMIGGDALAAEYPEFYELAFKYTAFELACALKPYFLLHLFERFPIKSAFYVDSDIQFYSSINDLHTRLRTHSIVLIPHSTQASDDELNDPTLYSETLLLLTGSYNAGFIGVSADKAGMRFLRWWKNRVSNFCAVMPSSGLYHDQRWLDLVPSLFERVYIDRSEELNVAFWNLRDRKIRVQNGRFYCGKKPLAFFHFSHVNLLDPKAVAPAWTLRGVKPDRAVLSLIKNYRLGLIQQGYAEMSGLPYGFARFDNGALIPKEARRLFQKASLKKSFKDPFSTHSARSFYQWMLKRGTSKPSPLELELASFKTQRSALDPKIRADLSRSSKSR
jgi:hypothetical protein